MGFMTAGTTQMKVAVPHVGLVSAMTMNSSARWTDSVFRNYGNVMAIRTAKTALTNTMAARPAPADPQIFSVPMETVCLRVGFATGMMIVGT